MTAHRILHLNAISTAACAAAMLAGRGFLHALFGLGSPILLDFIAVVFLLSAAALVAAARRRPVERRALIAFAIADAAWVVGSAIVLVLFWPQLTPVGRLLILAVALAVEAFAFLQFRAAGALSHRSPELA